MKILTLMSLLFWTAIANIESCSHGEIIVTGVSSPCFLAGRVSLCVNSEWRDVCQIKWDRNDTIVVCREFGFPAEGAQFCTSHCLGRNNSVNGLNQFSCQGDETKLADCSFNMLGFPCRGTVGVICNHSTEDCTTSMRSVTTGQLPNDAATTKLGSDNNGIMPTTDAGVISASVDKNSTDDTLIITSTTGQLPNDNNYSGIMSTTDAGVMAALVGENTTVGPALGTVIALLVFTLVGVVLGWAWTCYMKKRTSSRDSVDVVPNPSYSTCLPTSRYSSQKPGGAAPNLKPSQGQSSAPQGDERVYDIPDGAEYEVIEMDGAKGEAIFYHVKGKGGGNEDGEEIAYEVPVHIKPSKGGNIPKKEVQKAYSNLQYN